jgi:hypothetical protein
MAVSRIPGPQGKAPRTYVWSLTTPGPQGVNDPGDPNVLALPGDTPGPVGTNDRGASPAAAAGGLEKFLAAERDVDRLARELLRVGGLQGQPELARWQWINWLLGEAEEL